MGLFDRFRAKPDAETASSFRNDAPSASVVVGASENPPSLTFTDKNITYTGSISGFNYDAILRDKQTNIQELFRLSDYYVDADPIYRGIIKQV